MTQMQAIALWSYTAQEENELSFMPGDVIEIIELSNQDWFEGIHNKSRKAGFFPANHVQLVTPIPHPNPSTTTTLNASPSSAAPASATASISNKSTSVPLTGAGVEAPILKSEIPQLQQQQPPQKINLATPNISKSTESLRMELSAPLLPQEPGEENGEQSSDEDEEGLPQGWHIVRGADNVVYYWNDETDETSWDPPPGYTGKIATSPSASAAVGNTSTPNAGSPALKTPTEAPSLTNRIESVPSELIKTQGPISYKVKKDFGGIEPKKQHSWHTGWGVICIGYLIIYKDDISKLAKKKSIILPLQVVTLEAVVIRREVKDSGKKNLISIQSRSGAVFLIQPTNDNEVNDWLTIISDSTKEKSAPVEVDNVMDKLFVKPSLPNANSEKFSIARTIENLIPAAKEKEEAPQSVVIPANVEIDVPNKSTVKNRLNNFFKNIRLDNTPKPKEKEMPSEAILFGGSMENLAKFSGKNIPEFLQRSIEYVESSGGLESQGIYRLSGNASTVQKFRAQLNTGNYQDLYVDSNDVNVIAALVKLYFREIQEPVIPFAMYETYIATMKIDDYNARLIEIKTLIQKLPKIHYDVLEYLLRHLVKVAARSEVNKMEPSNLAIVFGPSLIRVEEKGEASMESAYANMLNMSFQNALCESLITQFVWIFDGNPN